MILRLPTLLFLAVLIATPVCRPPPPVPTPPAHLDRSPTLHSSSSTRRHSRPIRSAAVAVGVLSVGLIAACGPTATASTATASTASASAGTASAGGGVSASSLCWDYLKLPADQRYDIALRLSSQLHAIDAGNPMWGPNLDYNCAEQPSQTLRAAFGK
jgi:hypothetical protein